MARDNRLFYAVIACITGPIGGAVAGYHYAKNQQKLQRLDPSEGSAGDSTVANVILGLLIGPIAGAGFGWGCGAQERRIDQLTQTPTAMRNAPISLREQGYGIDPSLAQTQWRDTVAQQRAQMSDLQR